MSKATALFAFPYPEGTDAPAGPAQIEALAKKIEERLAEIELLLGTAAKAATPEPGQLVIVNGTSDPRYVAATGDIAVNSSGVFTIGAEKVVSSMIKKLAVEAAQLAGEAVETPKIKNFAVTEGKLGALAVTATKLAGEAVETGKIKLAAVTTAKIAAANITTALIADGAVTRAKLAADAKPFTWYEPKIIATEESVVSTSFAEATTADEVASVVLPTNGLIFVLFECQGKTTVEGGGKMNIFLNENTIVEFSGEKAEAVVASWATSFRYQTFTPQGSNTSQAEIGAPVETGQAVSSQAPVCIRAAAGTYNVSIRYKVSSGTMTIKNRKLYVWTAGY